MRGEPDWTRTDPQIADCAQATLGEREKRFPLGEIRRRGRATRALSTPFDEEKVPLPGQKYRTWLKNK